MVLVQIGPGQVLHEETVLVAAAFAADGGNAGDFEA
jgi:hypothetical protein